VETVLGVAERLRSHPPVKQFRIGEVARFSGLSRQTVHNYTIMGLISESEWTEGGHRLYGERVFETLVRIEQLKQTHTLREIRQLLDRERGGPVRRNPVNKYMRSHCKDAQFRWRAGGLIVIWA
jgi:DNA-binding transcriptional MerR regulator